MVADHVADDVVHPVFLGRAFQSGGGVHAVADDGEAALLFAAEVADDGLALMDADTDLEFTNALGHPVGVQCFQLLAHLQGSDHGVDGTLLDALIVVGAADPSPHGHNGVANELVDASRVAMDDGDHTVEVFVQLLHELLGRQLFG